MFDERIVGSVERIVYRNQENGYHVLSVLSRETGKECTVTANLLKIHEGVTMEFQGQWVSNPRFGTQFKAEKVIEVAPETKEALVRYLSSSFFKGIGPVIAKKIVGHFGDNTLEVLKVDIDRLTEVPGISKKKIEKIKESWIENSEINEIMVFLQSYNISTLFASKIYEVYGHSCINQIKENPYRLAQDVKGIGFRFCDKIALDMGFTKDCKERISAGILYILSEGENDGHCYLLYGQIIQKSSELLGVRVQDKINDVLDELIAENIIKLSNIGEEKRFYSNQIFYDERYCAYKIDVLKNNKNYVNDDLIKEWEDEIESEGVVLSDEQKDAVVNIVKNGGVNILTGSAGTGKTSTLKALLLLQEKLQIDFAICTPTGKSSTRVVEKTNYFSQTIHKLLSFNPSQGQFLHNEFNPLNIQFLILEEASMVNINLFASLLKALPNDCSLLLCGDCQQLSPIGSGSPFKDLINSGFVDVFRLTKIFRQKDKESYIINHAHEIIQGIEPQIESPLENPNLWTNEKKDCLFIDSGEFDPYKKYSDYPDWNSLYYGYDILEMVKKLYLDIIPKYYPEKKIQIISPMNKGEFGNDNINQIIREIVNPLTLEKQEIKLKFKSYRDFDVVIQTVNNYELGVTNGEIGIIKKVNPEENSALVEFEIGGKIVEYKKSDLLELDLGYSVSCHKFQGSETDVVIAVLANSHYPLLYRSMLYTLITRGSLLTCFVGTRRALNTAVKNVKDNQRQTSLIELLHLKQ